MKLVKATWPRGAHHTVRSGSDPARHKLRCRPAARLTRLWRERLIEPHEHWPAGRSGRQRYRRMHRAPGGAPGRWAGWPNSPDGRRRWTDIPKAPLIRALLAGICAERHIAVPWRIRTHWQLTRRHSLSLNERCRLWVVGPEALEEMNDHGHKPSSCAL